MACHLRWLTVSRPRIETLIIAEGKRRKGGGHRRKRKRERGTFVSRSQLRNTSSPRKVSSFKFSRGKDGGTAFESWRAREREEGGKAR